ncbi:iron-containing alcohol dehydrogenase [Leadbettera azotonutricia]|uniref:Putative iron dependent alcohol dehydrogenase n=1 Tax=Leadbettera azotonutricia (strain ATCC BAA-888 / DSM 13862 / ZAS-9) TaxID=545695 RepID=F5YG87_LEAAZ|nr:iron-containing alcohol dehydrogenase [Leadbettera azotonutricia]AEF80733.1 putative iron dependent alcohol dehydrogenase [Leadbettera azotonutricia ZAS-9]
MNELFEKSRNLLSRWKGDKYIFGRGVLPQLGKVAAQFGKNALVICNTTYMKPVADQVTAALKGAGVELAGGTIVPDAGPNAPRADVYRIETWILHYKPDVIIAVGGGSTIDACKAANFLATLGKDITPEVDHWFGTGIVSEALKKTGKKLYPLIAVETSASSGAHLTKYSNITDPAVGQKKLVVDEGIVPAYAVFDYDVTASMPVPVTIDGALDSIAHCFEVFTGLPASVPQEKQDLCASICEAAVELTVQYAPRVIKNPKDMEAREAIGMSTDLGGYAIMVGGTHGPHMTSFSLVNLTGHGTACGIMNPYYAVFFSPAIEKQLRIVGRIFKKYGHLSEDLEALKGKDLGIAVARGMIAFGRSINAPTTLKDLPKWDDSYVSKILEAAKDPQLDMKLKNMPVPLTAAKIDEYMGPVIRAAVTGDLAGIKVMV